MWQPPLSGFEPMRFEVARKEAGLNMHLPAVLMGAVRAKAKGTPTPATCGYCWKQT